MHLKLIDSEQQLFPEFMKDVKNGYTSDFTRWQIELQARVTTVQWLTRLGRIRNLAWYDKVIKEMSEKTKKE